MDAFPACCDITIGHEGGYGIDRNDAGDWTGGRVGSGTLRGTRFGISAAAFPVLDIANLTLDQAQAIYRALYWNKLLCEAMPAQLALLVFDAGVNNGVGAAARLLQRTIGVEQDGLLGPATMTALRHALGNGAPDTIDALCGEFQAQRLLLMTALSTWSLYGLGWARRLVRLPFQALRLAANDVLPSPQRAA